MIDRIKLILEKEDLSPAKFADLINIQRSAVSHILNGRNRPSMDVVLKILDTFPRINTDWLIRGDGEMYAVGYLSSHGELADFSISENRVIEKELGIGLEYSKEKGLKGGEKLAHDSANISEKSSPSVISQPVKIVTKIMVFYSDGTFDTFGLEQKSEFKS